MRLEKSILFGRSHHVVVSYKDETGVIVHQLFDHGNSGFCEALKTANVLNDQAHVPIVHQSFSQRAPSLEAVRQDESNHVAFLRSGIDYPTDLNPNTQKRGTAIIHYKHHHNDQNLLPR